VPVSYLERLLRWAYSDKEVHGDKVPFGAVLEHCPAIPRDAITCPPRQRAASVLTHLRSNKSGRILGRIATHDSFFTQQLESEADLSWLWNGLHTKIVDGFTFTMPDTRDNQKTFPQLESQTPGVGFPIARACTVVSLATACVCDLVIGPYEGKETGETAFLSHNEVTHGSDIGPWDFLPRSPEPN